MQLTLKHSEETSLMLTPRKFWVIISLFWASITIHERAEWHFRWHDASMHDQKKNGLSTSAVNFTKLCVTVVYVRIIRTTAADVCLWWATSSYCDGRRCRNYRMQIGDQFQIRRRPDEALRVNTMLTIAIRRLVAYKFSQIFRESVVFIITVEN